LLSCSLGYPSELLPTSQRFVGRDLVAYKLYWYEADLKRMAKQFVVELGWLQETTFPLELAQSRATLSAHDLLKLADSFYRYRMERWTLGEPEEQGVFAPTPVRHPLAAVGLST
jgi:hypothetical protein